MPNVIPFVHKSHAARAKKCSKQLYYSDILKLTPEFVNESSLTGNAFHKFADQIYKEKDKWDDVKYWLQFFLTNFEKEKERILGEGIELNTVEDLKVEDFIEMIVEFIKQPYNKYAEPVVMEAPFRFFIARGRKKYWFEGRLDALLKIETKYLKCFPYFYDELKKEVKKDYIYIHRDTKTGNRRITSEISLTTNDNINFYAYALAYGYFDLTGDGNYDKKIQLIPYAHALHYVRDYLKYKRKTGDHLVGDPKGPSMYFVKKNLIDLKNMEDELVNLHIKVNSGIYTRDGSENNLCDKFCGFKKMCLHEWHQYG